MATSLYQALRSRYPEAQITLLSQIPDHPVLDGLNVFDVVQEYSPSCDLNEFDLLVLPVFCGDQKVAGYFDRHKRVVSLDRLHAREREGWRNKWDGSYSHLLFYKHQFELNEDLGRELGFSGPMPALHCPQGDPTAYERFHGRVGLYINTPVNKFQALANRQWPLQQWARTVDLLGTGNIVLLGGPTDRPNLELLGEQSGAEFFVAPSLADFTALCRNLRALVTTDGGAMHVAATSGAPIISLHGTSSPILLHPWIYPEGKCIAILAPNTCSPCQRSYRLQLCETGQTQMRCMERITPEQITKSIDLIETQEKGTCMILRGSEMQTKPEFIRSWRRKLRFTVNYNFGRISLAARGSNGLHGQ